MAGISPEHILGDSVLPFDLSYMQKGVPSVDRAVSPLTTYLSVTKTPYFFSPEGKMVVSGS